MNDARDQGCAGRGFDEDVGCGVGSWDRNPVSEPTLCSISALGVDGPERRFEGSECSSEERTRGCAVEITG